MAPEVITADDACLQGPPKRLAAVFASQCHADSGGNFMAVLERLRKELAFGQRVPRGYPMA
jgi:hypothetical protein